MVLLLVALLIAVPIAELWVIIAIGSQIGVLRTFGLMVLMSGSGALLLRQQGTSTWRRLQSTLADGRVPRAEAVDGALIVLGGALLLTPGFLTDVVGLLLLIPLTRAVLVGTAGRFFRSWVRRRAVVGSDAGGAGSRHRG